MRKTNKLLRQGLLLEYFTLGWNIIGAVVAIASGIQASSTALVGFALDSLIEIGASTVVIWQLNGVNQKREQQALRLIGTAFFMLGTYILVQSSNTLLAQAHSSNSTVGIVWLIATFLVMLMLAIAKGRLGAKLDNAVLKTEARVTLVDAYLAGSVLIGLVLNATLGWWWADPIAGLVIVFYGFKEGWHAWLESAQTHDGTLTRS